MIQKEKLKLLMKCLILTVALLVGSPILGSGVAGAQGVAGSPDGVTIVPKSGHISVGYPSAQGGTVPSAISPGSSDNVMIYQNGGWSAILYSLLQSSVAPATQTAGQLATAGSLSPSDTFLISQGGTTIATQTLSGLTSYLATALNTPSMTVTPPPGIISGASAVISGSYSGTAPSALDYSLNGGASWTAASAPTIGSGVYSFSIAGLSIASYPVNVRNHTTTSVAAAATQPLVVAAGALITLPQPSDIIAGGAVRLAGTYIGNPTAINYQVDSGSWTSLVPAPTGGYYSGLVPGLSTGNHIFATEFADASEVSPTTGFVAVAPLPSITATAPSPVATLSPAVVTGTYTNGTPSGLNYSIDGGSNYSAVISPTISGGNYSATINGLADYYYKVTMQSATYAGANATTAYFPVGNALLVTLSSTLAGGSSLAYNGFISVSCNNVTVNWSVPPGGVAGLGSSAFFQSSMPSAPVTFSGAIQAPARPATYTYTWTPFVSGVVIANWTSTLTTTMPGALILSQEFNSSLSGLSLSQNVIMSGEYGGGSLTSGTGTIEYNWQFFDNVWRTDAAVVVTADGGGVSGIWTVTIPPPSYLGSVGFYSLRVRAAGNAGSSSTSFGVHVTSP